MRLPRQFLRKICLLFASVSFGLWLISTPFLIQRYGDSPLVTLGDSSFGFTAYFGPEGPIRRSLAFPVPGYSQPGPVWMATLGETWRFGDRQSILADAVRLHRPYFFISKGLPGPCSTGPPPFAQTHWGITCVIPFWIPFFTFLAPAIMLGYPRLKSHGVGCCAKCGYNLTAIVSGVCPECGKAIESPIKTTP